MALIALLVLAHLGCFIISIVLIEGQKQYIEEVDDAGAAIIALHRMLIDCRVLQELHAGVEQPGIFVTGDMQTFVDLSREAAEEFSTKHRLTYLGQGKLRRLHNRVKYKLQDNFETRMWNTTVYYDTDPPAEEARMSSLWELGNDIVAAVREVAQNHLRKTEGGRELRTDRQWLFSINNGPWSAYSGYRSTLWGLVERALAMTAEVATAMKVLLAIEGCIVFMAATIYVLHLTKKVALQRYNLFSVFLVLPAGFLRVLASKEVMIDEDDESDDGSDDGGLPVHASQTELEVHQEAQTMQLSLGRKGSVGGARRPLVKAPRAPWWPRVAAALDPSKWLSGGDLNLELGRKVMRKNSRDALRMAAPFALWGTAAIIVYAVTISQMNMVHGPFQMLNMINFLVFRITRGVFFSLEVCMATDPDNIRLRQADLRVRHEDFQADYHSFLYGVSVLRGLNITTRENPLAVDTPAVFQDQRLADLFFRYQGCLRSDASGCFPPAHKFHAATNNGIDAMAMRFIREVEALINDSPEAVGKASPRLEYIWQVGRHDLFDGMTTANAAFRSQVSSIFDTLKQAHAIVFALSVVLALWVALGMVKPFMKRNAKETRQIAELLSQLPAEMDVETLVVHAIGGPLPEDDGMGGGGRSPRKGGGQRQRALEEEPGGMGQWDDA